MTEIEQLVWALTYAAATAARETDPSSNALNAVFHFNCAEERKEMEKHKHYDLNEDVPY